MTGNDIHTNEPLHILPIVSTNLTIHSGEDMQIVFWDEDRASAASAQIEITQEANSTLSIIFLSLNQTTDTQIHITQIGERAETQFYGLNICGDTHIQKLHTRILHTVANGKSKQLYKCIVADKAQSAFVGELHVQPDAQKVEAYQTNRNILLSETAKMQTQPQLEIYADDVKCSHGATTGQLDETALFYMQQRCISPADARLLLLNAFATDILTEVRDSALQERLSDAVADMLQSLSSQQ